MRLEIRTFGTLIIIQSENQCLTDPNIQGGWRFITVLVYFKNCSEFCVVNPDVVCAAPRTHFTD